MNWMDFFRIVIRERNSDFVPEDKKIYVDDIVLTVIAKTAEEAIQIVKDKYDGFLNGVWFESIENVTPTREDDEK